MLACKAMLCYVLLVSKLDFWHHVCFCKLHKCIIWKIIIIIAWLRVEMQVLHVGNVWLIYECCYSTSLPYCLHFLTTFLVVFFVPLQSPLHSTRRQLLTNKIYGTPATGVCVRACFLLCGNFSGCVMQECCSPWLTWWFVSLFLRAAQQGNPTQSVLLQQSCDCCCCCFCCFVLAWEPMLVRMASFLKLAKGIWDEMNQKKRTKNSTVFFFR